MSASVLTGKTVFITGAGRGLGFAIAKRFAAEGARIFGIARTAEGVGRAQAALDNRATIAQIDVCDEAALASFIRGLPALDIAINNAAVNDGGPVLECSPELLRRVLEINVVGPYTVMREAAARMKESGGGHIINIASTAALSGIPNLSHYCASKHALLGMSRAARHELAPFNIRITTVCPFVIATDMVGEFQSDNRCLQPAELAEMLLLLSRAPAAIDIEEVTVRSTNWP
jgi:NAD(P)-dependent dehydrogenase (short-subunit alcohol dehydrogenase family)